MPKVLKKSKKSKSVNLEPSKSLKVVDVPIVMIDLSDENPNIEDDETFDQLVESIKKDGFDEPVHLVPGKKERFTMASGEHRFKAAKLLGFKTIPAVIKEDWTDRDRKIALVRRNKVRGSLDAHKFTKLYNELAKSGDKELLKAELGFTKKDAFDKLYKQVTESVKDPKKRKKLEEAKESIKSIDDLSSVLNTIFKEGGSELEKGYLVFSFGGKNHHYIKIDKKLDRQLHEFRDTVEERGLDIIDVFKDMLKTYKVAENGKKTDT